MRKCPACQLTYTRMFFVASENQNHFVHAGVTCVLDLETESVYSQLRTQLQATQDELDEERKLRREAEESLQSITKIALNQNYLEEIPNAKQIARRYELDHDFVLRLIACSTKHVARQLRTGITTFPSVTAEPWPSYLRSNFGSLEAQRPRHYLDK